VLRGQVLGAIIAPLSALAGLVNAPLQNLYGLIDARIEQLGGEGAAPAEPQAEANEDTQSDATASDSENTETTEETS